MKQGLGRREFLKTAAVAAAVPAVAAAADKTVPIRVFGKTGLRLPVLAYGGAALPRAWGNTLSREKRVELVRYAFDRGIRYFDTAGNYMESQSILGEALKDQRNRICLVSKVETTNPAHVRGQVEESMRELQTDHLDAILIHGTPGIQQMSVKRAMQIHAELVELREACLAKAHELKMGIAAMKVIGAGVLGGWAPHIVPRSTRTNLRACTSGGGRPAGARWRATTWKMA